MDMKEQTQNYLTAVAMASYNYSEGLGIDIDELSTKFAILLRNYQDRIKELSPQELALFMAFTPSVNGEEFSEFITVFANKALLSSTIESSKEMKDQIKILEYAQNAYYEDKIDYNDQEKLCDFLNGMSHSIRNGEISSKIGLDSKDVLKK